MISLRGDRGARKNFVDIKSLDLNLDPQGQGQILNVSDNILVWEYTEFFILFSVIVILCVYCLNTFYMF